jgi:hypothetical protein
MGLIPQSLLDQWNNNGCTIFFNDVRPDVGVDCEPIWDEMSKSWNDLNIYDFFRTNEVPITTPSAEDRMGKSIVNGVEKTYKRGMTQAEYTPWLKHIVNNDRLMYTGLSDYLNDADVRTALHIPESAPGWEECNMSINEDYSLQQEGSLWIYDVLRVNGYKMLFYSGETDGAIPTLGTKKWLKELNWPVTTPWAKWMAEDGQVNGWSTVYADLLNFTIIRGVGHMAPQWARQACLDMVNAFIS